MRLPPSLLNFGLRHGEKLYFRIANNIAVTRLRFFLQARLFFKDPLEAIYQRDKLRYGGKVVPAVWAKAKRRNRKGVILYLHGGAYVMGGPETHKAMLARLAVLSGIDSVLPDYRLAPEHPFPAAVDDALISYLALLERGYPAQRIVLGGDSAGGGLMLALLHVICADGLPKPGACFAFSPWTDLTLSGTSLRENAEADVFLPVDRTEESRDLYLAGANPADPRASPLFGTFKGAPPVLVQVGDTEILLDDSLRMVDELKAQGVDATVEIWTDMPHVWQIFQGHLEGADEALSRVAAFLAKTL